MQKHVARLLGKPVRGRKTMSVMLDSDQTELLEKLSLFFSQHAGRNISRNRVIEEAVRAFIDDSADYIADRYDLRIRDISLSELQAHSSGVAVDICTLDTVVIPVRDGAEGAALLQSGRTMPLQMDRDKLRCTRYVAFYFGSPTSAITHYARVRGNAPSAEDPKKMELRFDAPEELHRQLEWGDPEGKWLRRPRYTVLKMLLEASMIEELF